MNGFTLKKATLQVISGGEQPKTEGNPVEVQFNPASLKLTLQSRVEGGDTRGNQRRQWIGNSSTSLSFDLHFDTSEQGTTTTPVSVRSRTRDVEKFLLPREKGKDKQAQPKVRFSWGDLVLDGIIEQLTVDFDLFAQNGTPLRAKMSVTIKEQDARYQLGKAGAGANKSASSALPGGSNAGPGSTGSGLPDRVAPALGGESAADFLARNGMDPEAWRGIASSVPNPLSLEAGAAVSFDTALTTGAGIGASAGIAAAANLSAESALGLAAAGSASAGLALAAAGGVVAAMETAAQAQADGAAGAAREAFASVLPGGASSAAGASPSAPAAPPAPGADGGAGGRLPLQRTGLPSATKQQRAPSAPPPPKADPRSTSWGFGVPLRERIGGAAAARARAIGGGSRIGRDEGPTSARADSGAAPWTRLQSDRARRRADREQAARHPCGCSGPCGHRSTS